MSQRIGAALVLCVLVEVDQPPVVTLRPPIPVRAIERAIAALSDLVLATAVTAAA
jgi:hypothetical protein